MAGPPFGLSVWPARLRRRGKERAELVSDEQIQMRAFERHRRERHAALAEDYCGLIAELIDHAGEARAVDIARRLGISHATVVNTVGRLQRAGYVTSQPSARSS